MPMLDKSTKIVYLLKALGADVNARANDGSSALPIAFEHWRYKLLRLLAKIGADTNSVRSPVHQKLLVVRVTISRDIDVECCGVRVKEFVCNPSDVNAPGSS